MDGDAYDPDTGEIIARPAPKMAPEIARAIIAVSKQVRQLGADDRNEHGKYGFVSVDKFYERIGRLMAEAGLAVLINECASEVREGKSGNPWLFCRYELTFLHESGAMSLLPITRSLGMPISGPQAYGAAQSYVEKQFLRQVFKIPTGEKDADDTAQSTDAPGRSGGAGAPSAAGGTRSPPARQQAAPAPSAAKEEATKRYREIRAEIDAAMVVPDLDSIDGCLAWNALEAKVREDDPSVVKETMDGLRARIAKRRDMLLAQAQEERR